METSRRSEFERLTALRRRRDAQVDVVGPGSDRLSADDVQWLAPERRSQEVEPEPRNETFAPSERALRANGRRNMVAQEALVRDERLRSMGQMAAGIAHDYNNLLSVIMGFSELLLDVLDTEQDPKRLRDYATRILRSASDGACLMMKLRHYYEPFQVAETTDVAALDEVVRTVAQLFQNASSRASEPRGPHRDLRVELGDVPPVLGNGADLRTVVHHLILNAIDATREDGTILIRIRDAPAHAGAGRRVLLEVTDDGCGMDLETRQRCLEPFFTTRGGGRAGLGLSDVFRIVRRCDADIEVESAPGEGTTVRIGLNARDSGDVRGARSSGVTEGIDHAR